MGLFSMFKKEKQNNVWDSIDKSDFIQVFSACLGKMMVIQNRAAELVVKNRNWNVDFSKGWIAFGEDQYPVELIGTESNQSNTWNWAYNNVNHFPDSMIKIATDTYEKGQKWKLDALTMAQFTLDEIYNGHNLAIVACGISERDCCYYRGPHDRGAILVMFHGVSKEVFKPIDLLKFVSITGQCVQNFTVNHKIFVEAFLQWNQTKYTWDGDTIIADFSQKLYIVFEKVEDLYRIIEIKTK